MSECPVCGKGGVDARATRCPQCQADLECFALLDALHEGAPVASDQVPSASVPSAPAQSTQATPIASPTRRLLGPVVGLALTMLFAVLILQVLALRQQPAEPPATVPAAGMAAMFDVLKAMADTMSRLATRLDTLEARLNDLNAQHQLALEQAATTSEQVAEVAALVQAAHATQAPDAAAASADAKPPTTTARLVQGDGSIEDGVNGDDPTRHAAPGESPIGTAQIEPPRGGVTIPQGEPVPEPRFHHQLRPHETLWSIAERYYGRGWLYPVIIAQNPGLGIYHQGRGTLTLFRDPAQALAVYRRITPPGAERRSFRYQVLPGDDWRGLASRFLGRPSRARELMARNPGSDLAPGSQILIPLE